MHKHLMIASLLLLWTPLASAAEHGSIAIGTAEGKIGLGLSYGIGSSKKSKDNALRQCRKNSVAGKACKIVTTWSEKPKCGYVSIGSSSKGSGWGTGATPGEALRNCKTASKGRNDCLKPIGGCND